MCRIQFVFSPFIVLAICGCGNQPTVSEVVPSEGHDATDESLNSQTSIVSSINCQSKCISELCDSDCDGWYDDVEIEAGFNPCDSWDTEYCPSADTAARVCDQIVGCDSLNAISPVSFVAGDVFSFLTPEETDMFLSLVSSYNRAIDEQVDSELSSALSDLRSRGLSGSSSGCGEKCAAEKDRVQLKRAATFSAIERTFLLSGRALDNLVFSEIESFNCREYPNDSFNCSVATFRVTCSINLPCGF